MATDRTRTEADERYAEAAGGLKRLLTGCTVRETRTTVREYADGRPPVRQTVTRVRELPPDLKAIVFVLTGRMPWRWGARGPKPSGEGGSRRASERPDSGTGFPQGQRTAPEKGSAKTERPAPKTDGDIPQPDTPEEEWPDLSTLSDETLRILAGDSGFPGFPAAPGNSADASDSSLAPSAKDNPTAPRPPVSLTPPASFRGFAEAVEISSHRFPKAACTSASSTSSRHPEPRNTGGIPSSPTAARGRSERPARIERREVTPAKGYAPTFRIEGPASSPTAARGHSAGMARIKRRLITPAKGYALTSRIEGPASSSTGRSGDPGRVVASAGTGRSVEISDPPVKDGTEKAQEGKPRSAKQDELIDCKEVTTATGYAPTLRRSDVRISVQHKKRDAHTSPFGFAQHDAWLPVPPRLPAFPLPSAPLPPPASFRGFAEAVGISSHRFPKAAPGRPIPPGEQGPDTRAHPDGRSLFHLARQPPHALFFHTPISCRP